ncbi:MAG: polyprenyl synthetase family protein [Chloroflexi bacterium]|nr:polyprenyl synthetase family protein [Chloroflexota bacterium]
MSSSVLSAPAVLAKHRAMLEAALERAIGHEPAPLASAARYVMGWQDAAGRPAANAGKRIRPALCLLAAEVFGAPAADALPAAVAVELVHNFSLVHDEVQDHDTERHHRPTLWALLGEGQAINAGDFLYTRAIQALTDAAGHDDRRMRALGVLNRAIARMIAGQWDDIAFEQRTDVTVDDYLAMVAGKTGALLGAPLEMGALMAGADAPRAAALGLWGAQVGLAFQVQDDYLGIWGDPTQTGKSNSNDIARRKKTLPIIHGLGHPASRDAILAAQAGAGDVGAEKVADVVRELEQVQADRACRDYARAFADSADQLLESLGLPADEYELLRDIARYLVDRAV